MLYIELYYTKRSSFYEKVTNYLWQCTPRDVVQIEHADSLAFAYTIGEKLKKHITIFKECKWYLNLTCLFYFFPTMWC